MRLNIFTNSEEEHFDLIKETYNSFVKHFGEVKLDIYCDSHPNEDYFPTYKEKLEDYFNTQVIKTRSLSDGYIKSVKGCNDDYLFQCEHDWRFKNIDHSLEKITEVMEKEGLWYFRFSPNPNIEMPEDYKWQTFIEEKECDGFKYCISDNISNRPHIIDRKHYLKNILDKIERRTSSFGIEQNLQANGYTGGVYGEKGHKPCIKHLNIPEGDRNASDKSDIPNKKL